MLGRKTLWGDGGFADLRLVIKLARFSMSFEIDIKVGKIFEITRV